MSLQIWNRVGRIFFMAVVAWAVLLAVQVRAEAATCKAVFHEKSEFDDGKPVTGHGYDQASAYEDAVTRCTDKRMQKAGGYGISYDQGEDVILSCANLTCG